MLFQTGLLRGFIWRGPLANINKMHGRNLVGDTGDVSPHFFRRGGT